jgi:hypothetical protein
MVTRFGKARVFVEGYEVYMKRYSFLQQLTFSEDSYSFTVKREELGPLHGRTIIMHVATHLAPILSVCIPHVCLTGPSRQGLSQALVLHDQAVGQGMLPRHRICEVVSHVCMTLM